MVSHDLTMIRHLCDTVLWLEGSRMREIGQGTTVCDRYEKYVSDIMQGKNRISFPLEHIPGI